MSGFGNLHPGFSSLRSGFAPTSNLIKTFNFSTAITSGGLYTSPPSWLSISCATSGRTVQTSASTIVSGIGANAWRARNVGSGLGLSIETGRENFNPNSNNGTTAWILNGANVTNANGPDGSSNTAVDLTWTTGTAVGGYTFISLGGTFQSIISFWEKDVGGTDLICFVDQNVGIPSEVISTVGTWARYSLQWPAYSTVSPAWGTYSGGSNPNGQGIIWGTQVETALYPSSVIPTTGGPITRAADTLSTTTAIAPSGYLNMIMTFAPNFANTEQGVDAPLLWWDTNNQVFIQQSTSKIIVKIAGVSILSSALTWSREQAITLTITDNAAGFTMTISGATTGNGQTTSSGAAFTTQPTTYLLGSSAGGQECIDLRSITFNK